jgi:polar amino acid transport system substrate-binding protein
MRFCRFMRLASVAVSLTFVIAAGVHAQDAGTLVPGKLVTGVDTNNKPYAYIDHGRMTGFDVELLRAIAAKLGLGAEFRAQDFGSLLPSVSDGQIDLAAGSISITKERLSVVDFSEGYLTDLLSVASLPGSPVTNDKASVKGRRIGVVQGTIEDIYSDSYLPQAVIVHFPNLDAGFQALRSEQIDGYFVDKTLADSLRNKYPDLRLAERLDISALDLPAGFAIRKGNATLEAALNRAIEELVADGTWLKLYTRFHPGYPPPASLPPYAMKTGG